MNGKKNKLKMSVDSLFDLGFVLVIALYRNLSAQKCVRTEAYKLFGDLKDARVELELLLLPPPVLPLSGSTVQKASQSRCCGFKQKFPDVFFTFICTTWRIMHKAKKKTGPKSRD